MSMVEAIDGMRAVEAIEIGDRIALRETLRATLIKNLRHEVPSTLRSTCISRPFPSSCPNQAPGDPSRHRHVDPIQ